MGAWAWSKVEARHAIIASGVPYTLIQCSIWTEYLLSPMHILEPASRTVHITGSMDGRLSTTTLHDMAALVLAIISDPSTLNADIRIASQTMSWSELLAAAERATGDKWTASMRSVEETQAALAANRGDFRSMFEVIVALSKGVAWSHEETWNFQHRTGVKTTTVEEFLRQKLTGTDNDEQGRKT
jgi:uncharacterized protein YbjT (DUF2867 family)